jgi:hypothetical protein
MNRNVSMFLGVATAAAGLQLLAASADAHHSAAPFYDETKTVEIRVVVTRWSFVNPHPFLYVDVQVEQGETQEWIIEFAGAVRMRKIGWSPETFTPGEIVSAVGHPPKAEGQYGMFSPKIMRKDGTVIPIDGTVGGAGVSPR